jgi:putative PIN family toxin of toxin-antitoxin system
MIVHRVVFDTSTLVSAALRPDSVPHQALLQAISSCDLCASEATLRELKEVLARRKFGRYLTAAARKKFVEVIENHVRRFVVRETDALTIAAACRDSEDNKFLALAAEAEAQALLSSDEDLLVLDPWNHLRIVRPAGFLALIG